MNDSRMAERRPCAQSEADIRAVVRAAPHDDDDDGALLAFR